MYTIEMKNKESVFLSQYLPLILTVVIFLALSGALYLEIIVLNRFSSDHILTEIRWGDVLVGMTIYLKTSVDFAIFIGNLMSQYPGWKNRIAIELGTAVGNALGTIIVLAIWSFFREIEWLLATMIFIAALVLLRLAQDGVEHAKEGLSQRKGMLKMSVVVLERILTSINSFVDPVLKYIIPHASMRAIGKKTLIGVCVMSFTIPFILGLDDFAGYVPLFSIINVFGFSIGVLAGHMILNAFLFISPKKTIAIVKNSIISFIGSLAFIALAIWGFYEVYRILSGAH